MFCSLYSNPLDLDDIVNHLHYNLKMVCITGFCGNAGQVELVKYILRNALILEHMVIIDPKGTSNVPHLSQTWMNILGERQ